MQNREEGEIQPNGEFASQITNNRKKKHETNRSARPKPTGISSPEGERVREGRRTIARSSLLFSSLLLSFRSPPTQRKNEIKDKLRTKKYMGFFFFFS